MAFCPVVASTGLAEHEVIRAEDLSVGSGSDGVHRAWLEIHEDGTGHIAPAARLVEVHIDALELEVAVTVVGASWVNAVLVANDLCVFVRSQTKECAIKDVQKHNGR